MNIFKSLGNHAATVQEAGAESALIASFSPSFISLFIVSTVKSENLLEIL
jgi:hypothetical protein